MEMSEIMVRSDLAYAQGQIRAYVPFINYVKTHYPEIADQAALTAFATLVDDDETHVHDIGQTLIAEDLSSLLYKCIICNENVKIMHVDLWL